MKSTYKLFGTVWDGMPDNVVPILTDSGNQKESKIVSFKSLLCASCEEDVAKIMGSLNNLETIGLDMDYWCDTDNPVIKAFVSKRKRQIEAFLFSKAEVAYVNRQTEQKESR